MRIRTYEKGDTEELMQLFYDTVHEVNIQDYTQEQVNAWAPDNMSLEAWSEGFEDRFVYIAEEGGTISGFGELEPNGHIARFFCHKAFQRQGVGSQILNQIEAQAKSLGLLRLFTEASITARPFFEHKGFVVLSQEVVDRRGQKLMRFQMEKKLR
ncbi:GNAT family N-acetyltransferase [Kovacikia minuta CCNUW1]|uniref:GNAT family N-acetyltransferase n=1 Tax=Kovacikia minuta TaxID=2931930 RepID=UPI001CCFDCD3|nr:GNAT family N-acetyltransferase [Kovacikia minuta]UBF27834.1 GNAT family N-acetyltransferase [Kovacikia minuta CCNUW1]